MAPVLTCITGGETPVVEPEVLSVNSPDVGQIEVVGTDFVTALVNRLVIVMDDAGPTSFSFYDPTGPDAGLNAGLGNTIISWTDTSIIVDNAGMTGFTTDQIGLQDTAATYFLFFTGAGITGVTVL